MNSNGIFNSLSDPVPPVRRDVQLIPVRDNGQNLLYFFDSMGYMPSNFAVDRRVEPVLSLFNGSLSCTEISGLLKHGLSNRDILSFAQLLDENCALHSPFYDEYSIQTEIQFEEKGVRKAAFAAESYPSAPKKLSAFLTDIMNRNGSPPLAGNPKALYAPHIDLRVGARQYAEAFHQVKNVQPKRVVILATSHYAACYNSVYEGLPFIGSNKTFQIPGREFKPDSQAISLLEHSSPENGFTTFDRAHRIEHSIELHLLFASAIWPQPFSIIPILVDSIDELFYQPHGDIANKISLFSKQLKALDDGNTFFLISGDLSHVGKKFGDPLDANSLRKEVEKSDKTFIGLAEQGKSEQLLGHVGRDYDATRICGFPPLYTFLQSFPDIRGKSVNYHWWDEKERESAVSFGAIVF